MASSSAADNEKVLIGSIRKNLEELTRAAEAFYDSRRARNKVGVFSDRSGQTSTLSAICLNILRLINSRSDSLLTEQQLYVLEGFVTTLTEYVQYTIKGERTDMLDGCVRPDQLKLTVCFSRNQIFNLVCVAHEIGHLIHFLYDPPHKLFWDYVSKIVNDGEDYQTVWYRWIDVIQKEEKSTDIEQEYKSELIADSVSIGVLKACDLFDLGELRRAWKEWSADQHIAPRTKLAAFLEQNPRKRIHWFEKARDGIRIYDTRPDISFDVYFDKLFRKSSLSELLDRFLASWE